MKQEKNSTIDSKINVLDLFSGIGGFSLGLERTGGFRTVAFCEINPYCQAVLRKHWPGVPIHEDVKKLTAADVTDKIGVICGGFPCQDISSAGRKVGISGARSGLWKEYARIVREFQPQFVIVENSAALLNRGMGDVLGDLAALGYGCEWHCIPASALGAPHGRDRVWIVAYPDDKSESTSSINDEACWLSSFSGNHVANTKRGQRPLGWLMERIRREWESTTRNASWHSEDSPLGMGVDDGLSSRLDRLAALGNAVVTRIPELLGNAILRAEQ